MSATPLPRLMPKAECQTDCCSIMSLICINFLTNCKRYTSILLQYHINYAIINTKCNFNELFII